MITIVNILNYWTSDFVWGTNPNYKHYTEKSIKIIKINVNKYINELINKVVGFI